MNERTNEENSRTENQMISLSIFKYTCKLCKSMRLLTHSVCDEHYSLHAGCWDHWAMPLKIKMHSKKFIESTNLWAKHELLMYCVNNLCAADSEQALLPPQMCEWNSWRCRWRLYSPLIGFLVFSVNFFVCGKK